MSLDSTPSTSEYSEKCLVCDQTAHGLHFDVVTCRACAAFFKRAFLGKYLERNCQPGTGRCGARSNGRFCCKRCRLKQCLDVGMNPDRFQFDRDLISNTDNFVMSRMKKKDTIPTSMESFVGRPSFLITFDPGLVSTSKKTVDFTSLLENANEVLRENRLACIISHELTGLRKMAFGLTSVRESGDDNMKFWTKIGKEETFHIVEEDFLSAAKWLTYCDELQKLPLNAKMQVLKTTWQLWIRLEKITATAEMRLKQKCPNNFMMATKNVMLHCQEIEIDTSWFSNYGKEQLAFFLDPSENEFIDSIVEPLMKLQPTPVEQAYMLAQLCFQFAGKYFQGDILETTETILEKLSNDLHDYYINELKTPNYSGRLAKLMKLNNILKKDLMQRIERKDIARLFDIFNAEFSHPEIFYGYQ